MKCFNTFILGSIISVNSLIATSQIPENICDTTEKHMQFNGEAALKYKIWEDVRFLSADVKGKFVFKQDNAWAEFTPKFSVWNACNKNTTRETTVEIEKCLVGYTFSENSTSTIYAEIGRNKLENLFDSKLQFGSMFNGLHLAYKTANFMVHGGPHIISNYDDEYGAIAETSYKFDIMPLKLTYSVSHWNQKPENFTISQFGTSYDLAYIQGKPLSVYSAVLLNHNVGEENLACYSGIKYGKITKKGDYIVDVNIQHAEANSIPYHEYKGVGDDGDGIELKTSYAVTDQLIVAGKIAYTINDSSSTFSEVSVVYKW